MSQSHFFYTDANWSWCSIICIQLQFISLIEMEHGGKNTWTDRASIKTVVWR